MSSSIAAVPRYSFNPSKSRFLLFRQCVVRLCCIRSFGHFLTGLQGNVLHYNPEAGIFTSISQSEQENMVQQAKAQFRMVRTRSIGVHEVIRFERQRAHLLLCTKYWRPSASSRQIFSLFLTHTGLYERACSNTLSFL